MEERILIPDAVADCMESLEDCGFCAYLVGGCVRDALLGQTPHDYDLTTDATPQQMLSVFEGWRVIPTGLQHGTLTVLSRGMPIEITTFRVDGVYTDNRHPSSVSFSSKLEDDLSRRDFTVNAMAYRPCDGVVDCFDGMRHLQERKIVCVGDPDRRFSEDGLRLMRALRFASVLGFSVDTITGESIHRNRLLLQHIAVERIYSEWIRLLQGRGAAAVLSEYEDVIAVFLPEREQIPLSPSAYAALARLPHDTKGAGKEQAALFLAAYLSDLDTQTVSHILHRLHADNRTRLLTCALIDDAFVTLPFDASGIPNRRALRRFLRGKEREYTQMLFTLRMALREEKQQRDAEYALARAANAVYEEGACLSLSTLAVRGNDLRRLGITDGKRIGDILEYLLCAVIDEELPNRREELLDAAVGRWKGELS